MAMRLSDSSTGLTLLFRNLFWILGDFYPRVKRQMCEAGLLPPTTAEVKKILICASIPPYTFKA
jgi:hypothetical protein